MPIKLMQEHLSPKQRRPSSLFCLARSYYRTSLLFLYVMFCLYAFSLLKVRVTFNEVGWFSQASIKLTTEIQILEADKLQ